jgi:putative phosphoesterase
MRVAVISDVHGNRWALEAVLADIRRRAVEGILDLGDSLYGPLDPRGTADLLIAHEVASVRGNEDRVVLAEPQPDDSATLRYTRSCLSAEHVAWLAALPDTRGWRGELLCCHGTPTRDETYLLETLAEGGVLPATGAEIEARLSGVREPVVLCGHSHVPRAVARSGGRLVVNPGSVGLPAYRDDAPVAHAMEAGSPHARFALVERAERGWRVEHVAVAYDWEAASGAAAANGRADWAEWLLTGRAGKPA